MKSVEVEEDTILYKLHTEASKRGRNVLSLRAYQVIDYSSQYGSDDSISYTAENIIGPPTIFPRTGDNAYSFQLRTYGEWWQSLPSTRKMNTSLPHGTRFESQDFIEFHVEKHIVPLLMRVYEVYNPGAIVKIMCYCYNSEKWVILWQGDPQVLPPDESNCFSVDFNNVNFLSDYYRIEFHHKHLSYFCEIDGLILYGEDIFPQYFPRYTLPISTHSKHLRSYFNSTSSTESSRSSRSIPLDKGSYFDALPTEVVYLIISYLDLQSLCVASTVSKLFQKLCSDPVLYRDLNLQPYWHLVDANTLKSLQPKLTALRKFSLAWCGGQGRIAPPYFIEFIENSCQNITSLNLSNCQFVNNNCLKSIASNCPLLKDLELRSCRAEDLTQTGFKYISQMTNVTYLDLYRTLIDKNSINLIIKSLKLEHLFLGSCTNIDDINEVAWVISRYLRYSLKTLDLWRATNLRCLGMHRIAEHCNNLVEVDLGWCYQVDASCGCIRQLIQNCPKLKKLFLTAIRTISSSELNAISSDCPDIEQLDILGTNDVSVAAVKNLLQTCKKLKLLDVSYCDTSIKEALPNLEASFPNIKIKCSSPLNFIY